MIVCKRTHDGGKNGKIEVNSGVTQNPRPTTDRGNKRAACKRHLKIDRKPTPQELRDFEWKPKNKVA
jgi:hypothetical protein